MARRRDAFPGEPQRGTPQKYPWAEWTDGSVWEIRHGEDYDVPTENMRTNLHMRATADLRKVRTQKITDAKGEGLVFQFLAGEEEEAVKMAAAEDPGGAQAAIDQLYRDAVEIYERARDEVTIPWKDGRRGPYVAVRYKQTIDKGYAENALVPAIARIVRKPTLGFGHLEAADRPDLMVENLVIDRTKPYHRLFTAATVQLAQDRMDAYYRRHRGES
jgi:hypothetical protein